MYKFLVLATLLFQGYIMASPFNFDAGPEVAELKTQAPNFIKASDNIDLAYYSFLPTQPDAVMIFYHGSGFWSDQLCQYMAQGMAQKLNVGTYLFDIRGHGNSQGDRGDAPSAEQVWQDVSSAIDFVHQKHPTSKIILGGHSSGAGLILNYNLFKQHPAVSSYLFLAPFLGSQSNTFYQHTDPEEQFAKDISLFRIIAHSLTGGFLFAHSPVIYFNYPEEQRRNDPHILEYHTNTITHAISPYDAHALFAKLDKPFTMLIGADDEQFIPEKVIAFHDDAVLVKDRSISQIVLGATHLSVVHQAPELLARLLQK